MLRQRYLNVVVLAAGLALFLSGCATEEKRRPEDFQATETFSRTYSAPPAEACEAGRRALMGQGYYIDKAETGAVSGHKSFEMPEDSLQTQIQFQMICSADDSDKGTTVFVNAVRDRYAIKKSSNSASVGVSILGSVSMPFGSSADSLVKVASETISRSDFYDGFFNLLKKNLPKSAQADSVKQQTHREPAKKAAPAAESAPKPASQPAPAAPAAGSGDKPASSSAPSQPPAAPAGAGTSGAAPSGASGSPSATPPAPSAPVAAPPSGASPAPSSGSSTPASSGSSTGGSSSGSTPASGSSSPPAPGVTEP